MSTQPDEILMRRFRSFIHNLGGMTYTLLVLLLDAARFLVLCLRPAPALAAENLFLRQQLAQYQERHVKPRCAYDATRMALSWLSRFFDWRRALVSVKPMTLIRWHRQGFRLFWRWKSTPGRPPLATDWQALIRRMALENPTWGQERIANELWLKLGLRGSPRTVRKYMPGHCGGDPGKRRPAQRWSTFLRHHAKGLVACDFCVVVTVTCRVLYVFVGIAPASRRLVHVNVPCHPTSQWTMQQFRDAICSQPVDQGLRHRGLRTLKTPVRTPVANTLCERVIGTMRRACLDCMMPLGERLSTVS